MSKTRLVCTEKREQCIDILSTEPMNTSIEIRSVLISSVLSLLMSSILSRGMKHGQELQMHIEMLIVFSFPVFNFYLWIWIRECHHDCKPGETTTKDLAQKAILKSSPEWK